MSNYDGQNPYYGGAGGGGGGGGFMPGGSPYGSQDSPGGKKGKGNNNTIRPVTVKQINNADQVHPDSDFSIDNAEVSQVLLVGSVHNKSVSATNVSYEIGDGTGYVDVRLWLDSADDEAGKMDGIDQDKYIAIMGTIKMFGGKRHVSATHVRLITDSNEIYHHLLKALYVSLTLRNPGGAMNGHAQGNGNGSDYNAVSNPLADNASAYAALPPLQRMIMEVVAANNDDEGMHVSAVSRGLGKYGHEQVMEAVESLMSEGMLFSTIDDLHVKAV